MNTEPKELFERIFKALCKGSGAKKYHYPRAYNYYDTLPNNPRKRCYQHLWLVGFDGTKRG